LGKRPKTYSLGKETKNLFPWERDQKLIPLGKRLKTYSLGKETKNLLPWEIFFNTTTLL
jgi:hypothetical protein